MKAIKAKDIKAMILLTLLLLDLRNYYVKNKML